MGLCAGKFQENIKSRHES